LPLCLPVVFSQQASVTADQTMSQTLALTYTFLDRERIAPVKTGRNSPLPPHLHIEFPSISTYAKDADEFVRLSCRGFAGWRRDEWAYSPLFICGKRLVFWQFFWGKPHFTAAIERSRERWQSSWKQFDRRRHGWPLLMGWTWWTWSSWAR